MLEPRASSPLDPSHFKQSPKRKRGLPAISTIPPTPPRSSPDAEDMRFNPGPSAEAMRATSIPSIPSPIPSHIDTRIADEERDDGASSPRTKVANKFQELGLQESGVIKFDLGAPNTFRGSGTDGVFGELLDRGEEEPRKRVKLLAPKRPRSEIPETPQPGQNDGYGQQMPIDPMNDEVTMEEGAKGMVPGNEVEVMVFRGSPVPSGDLGQAYSSVKRFSDSKSSRKRAWTPTLFEAGFKRNDVGDGNVVDEDRAALTWHDDEITGHDPTDPDDDGVGINGIGFKPTAAEAEKRSHQRRQQMAEYKTREMKEARKSRMDRRKGSAMVNAKEEQESARRVRFMDTEETTILT
ncbi:hypothetical protein JHW43_002809 [Diplocarpon mali]|nr:hypothetical protein JHW43_002809 [Diplocarpon mali]